MVHFCVLYSVNDSGINCVCNQVADKTLISGKPKGINSTQISNVGTVVARWLSPNDTR